MWWGNWGIKDGVLWFTETCNGADWVTWRYKLDKKWKGHWVDEWSERINDVQIVFTKRLK